MEDLLVRVATVDDREEVCQLLQISDALHRRLLPGMEFYSNLGYRALYRRMSKPCGRAGGDQVPKINGQQRG